MKRINVTKSFLPPIEEYKAYLDIIWENGQLTNQGPLLRDLEAACKEYLDVSDFQLVSNGTTGLQLALRALNITEGEVITTPFSYVATVSSILWERCNPVFVDIDPVSLCIDPDKIEAAITDKTKAIMPVHVFGNACDVEKIEAIAKKYNLKVIFDGAHAFGAKYNGRSLLSYGDVTMCSLHSTKLFHTIEGGCLIASNKYVSEKIELIKRFGHTGDEHYTLGLNGKASEFQAAMGLSNIKYVDQIIDKRRRIVAQYDSSLGASVSRPATLRDEDRNYAYYPVILKSEQHLLGLTKRLEGNGIFPRRYFYPSLNTLPYLETTQSCPISEDIASRILCLPLYDSLDMETIDKICKIVNT